MDNSAILEKKISETEDLVKQHKISYTMVTAEELIYYFSEPAPSGDITTINDVISSKWLLLHELIELSEIKKKGYKVSPRLLHEEKQLVYETHYTAFKWEMELALYYKDYKWIRERISLVDSWTKYDEGLTEDQIRKYEKLKKKLRNKI